ncbi:Hypothetical protein A7982_07599 [Minicystis rosea]|nr:Hypothetical protein A7982_07599 [Minicystis rosea]
MIVFAIGAPAASGGLRTDSMTRENSAATGTRAAQHMRGACDE